MRPEDFVALIACILFFAAIGAAIIGYFPAGIILLGVSVMFAFASSDADYGF
jgi:hypothetical protein